jgi:hypothetical protein
MVLGASALAEGSVGEGGCDVKWLPHHRFEIDSPLKADAAMAAMAAHTEPENWFRFTWPSSANNTRFEGSVTTDGFHVRRVAGYRNSFLPVIDGEIHAAGRGSRIQVRMRMFVFVYAFLAFWIAALLAGAASFQSAPGFFFALLMLVFVYGMTLGGFWYEANRQERTLREIFQAATL